MVKHDACDALASVQIDLAAHDLGIHAILFRDTAQAIADITACLQAHRV